MKVKKLLKATLILGCTGLAFADINVTPGSGKTVATETNSSREYQAVELVGPGATSTATFTANGLKVDGSAATQPVSGTVSINAIPTGSNVIGGVSQSGTFTETPGTGTWQVGGQAASGAAPSGNPVQNGVVVTSGTVFQNIKANNTMVPIAGDQFGRILVQQVVPWGMVIYATATLTATTTETIFISSAGANTYTHVLGCIAENTSATNTDITFRNSGVGQAINSFALGMPANFTPSGWMSLGLFGIQKLANAHWTITSGASVSSLKITCAYYQTTEQ